jgi:hypothetical protein
MKRNAGGVPYFAESAVQALLAAAGMFPGGQLYAGPGGFSPGRRVASGVVVARWLRALGVHPQAVLADAAEAAALFRSLTAASPVSVLADDADDARQVRDLLPGAARVPAASVTGRRGPVRPGTAARRLGAANVIEPGVSNEHRQTVADERHAINTIVEAPHKPSSETADGAHQPS